MQTQPPPLPRPNLILCPDCQNSVSKNAPACPKCGRVIKSRQSATGIVAAMVIGLVGGYVLLKFFGYV